MSSYWIEHQAREHLFQLRADARGDQKTRPSDATEPAPAKRGHRLGRRALDRARALVATVVPFARRHEARAR